MFASVLHYLGFPNAADVIVKSAPKKKLLSGKFVLNSIATKLIGTELKYLQPKYYKKGKLNIMVYSDFPTIAILEGNDGSCSHSITTIGKWIFDSNLEQAMELNQDNLDWCVSSKLERGKFVGIIDAVCFKINPKQKKFQWKYKADI